jgi:hypothetical protein
MGGEGKFEYVRYECTEYIGQRLEFLDEPSWRREARKHVFSVMEA